MGNGIASECDVPRYGCAVHTGINQCHVDSDSMERKLPYGLLACEIMNSGRNTHFGVPVMSRGGDEPDCYDAGLRGTILESILHGFN